MATIVKTFKHDNNTYEIRVSGDDNHENGQRAGLFLKDKLLCEVHLPQFAESNSNRTSYINIKEEAIDFLKNLVCKKN